MELDRKKLAELLEQEYLVQEEQIRQLQQQLALLESIAKQKLSKEAIARYGALKIAHQELAIKAIALIAQAVASGEIKEMISDEEFKEFLRQIKEKREFKLRR